MISILKIQILFSCLIILCYSASAPPTYYQTAYFRAGTVQTIFALKTSTDTISNFPISYNSALPSGTTHVNVLISLSSFDCLASNQFSFNISAITYDVIGFIGRVEIIGNTYFNLMKVNYLGLAWNTPPLQINALYRDCFLTTGLATGVGDRTQIYTKQNFNASIANGTDFLVQSFITGLKFLNNKDIFKSIKIDSQIISNTSYINHTVKVNGNTQLQWVCIGTIIIQTTFSTFAQEKQVYRIGTFDIIRVPQDIDITTFPNGYLPIYDQQDNKFFGLTQLQLYLGKPYQILNVKTENIGTVQVGYQGMATAGKVSYFFLAKRLCSNVTLTKYSIVDKLCYDACPTGAGQYQSSGICYACDLTCKTCVAPGSNTSCTSCQASNFRVLNGTGRCDCMSGYVQDNVPICPPCSNFIYGCAVCLSQTVCLNCTGVFVFVNGTNGTNTSCDCPVGTYYVALNNTCATYPGCVVANIQTNFIYCYACDTTQHFYLDDASRGNTFTCKCDQFFTQSGQTCADLCGDGVNTNVNSTTYCDDANFNNLDGCNQSCAIQSGYGCFNPPLITRSYCSPIRQYSFKYLYAQRVVNQNSGNFLFEITPVDPQLAASDFTYYVESTIPHTRATGTYDPSTSILKIKVQYLRTIQDQTHTMRIILDPYKMTVTQKVFTFSSSGVNFDLTFDQNPKLTTFVFYGIAVMSGLIVIASIVFIFINYKIAGVQLLLSAQIIYLGVIASNQSNLSIYSLSNLKYLVGFNTIQQFQISKYNYNTPFLISSYTYAQFLLNFNYMGIILALVILIVLPLKLNVAYKYYRRNKYTSPEMQQKLMQQDSNLSLKQLSTDIKSAQFYADTYIDRVYFAFSLIVFMPIVVYFAIQLGFIGKIGRYQLNAFANIILSILLLMIDFCFFILVFQDTDRKLKTFNFGSKKLKSYPYRLMMFYFTLSCIFTIVLLSNMTFYILFGLTFLVGLYIVIQNPYDKWSFQYFDALSKPLISIVALGVIKSISFFTTLMIYLPIAIFVLLLISLVTTTIRVVKVKLNRADTAKKILQDSGDVQDDVQFDKNLKQTDRSQFNSEKQKKQGKLKNNQKDKLQETDEQKDKNLNLNEQSAQNMLKKDNVDETDQLPEDDEDQLARIKRSLRQDLKKRRGVINKVNDDVVPVKQKKPKKPKKSKHTVENDSGYQFI